MLFDIKATEFIDLPSILHDPVVRSTISSNFDIPTVFYSLRQPIHSRVFVFTIFMSKLNFVRILQVNTILPCNCERYEFVDQHYKHILTGTSKIIRSNKLRNLFTNESNWEDKIIYFETVSLGIITGLNESIEAWCQTCL